MEHAALQSPLGQLSEEALDGDDARRRDEREVECKTGMPRQPLHNLRMFAGGVVVEDHMRQFEPFRKFGAGNDCTWLAKL